MAGLQYNDIVANQQGLSKDQLATQAQAATIQPGQMTPAPTLANGQTAGSPQTGVQAPGTQQTPPPGLQMPTTPTNVAQTPPPGLQMPTGAAANSVYDPITGQQQTPAEKALNEMKASKTPPPQESGAVGSQVSDVIAKNSPPVVTPPPTTPNVDNFFKPDANATLQDVLKQVNDFFNPEATNKTLTDQLAKISTDQTTLSGLNTQLMNVDTVMKGTEDDLRKEIQGAGGLATNSQILALTTSRNKTLLQQATEIQNKITTTQNAIANDTTLYQNEKEMANTQFTQRTALYQIAQTNYNNMVNAQKETANTIIQAIGYKGYLQNLQAQGPSAVANAEKALGLGSGGLQSLVDLQKQQQNATAIANSGATTPFVNKNGEIQSQTGYAYTSEQDFFNKTGMTIQQAQDKGMVSAFQPPLKTQLEKVQVAEAQAKLANAPLETEKLKAEIAHTKAETAKAYGDLAKASQAEQAVDPTVLQGMLNVYKTTGVLPPFGLSGKSPLRTQFFAALGGSGGQDIVAGANTNKAVLQGLKTAYSTQQNQLSANKTAIGTLDKQLDLAKVYSDKVSRSNSPFIAKYQNALKSGVFGDPDTAAFNNIVKTASAEFAKILSGSSASISGATVSSQAEAEKLLNSAMSKGQFNEVMGLMQKEAKFRLSTQQGTINELQTQIGNIGKDTTNPTAPLNIGSSGSFTSGVTWKIIQ